MVFEGEGGGESGDAAADDGDAGHQTRLPASGLGVPEGGFAAEYSWIRRARFFTFSTGVSGRMPWPRLKMWPGRPAAWRRMASARDLISFQSAKSSTGSRLPCTAPLLPRLFHPVSSGMRQSRPRTSAPDSCIDGKRVELS